MKHESKRNLIGSALLLAGGYLLFKSSKALPKKLAVIKPFDKEKFLGSWFEIARLNHPFETDLSNVTATYSDNGSKIKVVNRGYDEFNLEWVSITGKAKFKDDKNRGALKVSFFGPFYSDYNIIEIDEDYNFALIAGEDLNFLWILSRFPEIPKNIKNDFLAKAKNLGYKTKKLTWVDHGTS